MKEKRAFKLLAKLEKLRGEYKEIVLCDELSRTINDVQRRLLAGKISGLEERLRQSGYDPRRTKDVDA